MAPFADVSFCSSKEGSGRRMPSRMRLCCHWELMCHKYPNQLKARKLYPCISLYHTYLTTHLNLATILGNGLVLVLVPDHGVGNRNVFPMLSPGPCGSDRTGENLSIPLTRKYILAVLDTAFKAFTSERRVRAGTSLIETVMPVNDTIHTSLPGNPLE